MCEKILLKKMYKKHEYRIEEKYDKNVKKYYKMMYKKHKYKIKEKYNKNVKKIL